MTSVKFVFCLTCLVLGSSAQRDNLKSLSSVHQVRGFLSVKVGDDVTLRCFHNVNDVAWLFWYKQTLGEKPKLISSVYVYDATITFYNEFKNDERFTLRSEERTNHLSISKLNSSDSATYYCANSITFVLSFAEGTVVSVRGTDFNNRASVHQSASGTIQPGASVTLTCFVRTGTCDGEHSVYWFRDSGGNYSGIIYAHEDDRQCDKNPETKTCFYSLSLQSLTRSHAGTYYCAVASCGTILFGNGTNVDAKDELSSYASLVYFLSGALTFTTILAVLLTVTLCKINKANSCRCAESHAKSSAASATETSCYQDTNNLVYAAVSGNPLNRSRQRNTTNGECVYSSVNL